MGYIDELKQVVGPENVNTGKIDCFSVSRDLSVHEGFPEVIVFARSTDEVVGVVKVAAAHKIPVTARGAGTSATGAALASKGGILLDLSRMNQIKELNKNDRYVMRGTGDHLQRPERPVGTDPFFSSGPRQRPHLHHRRDDRLQRQRGPGREIRDDPGLCDGAWRWSWPTAGSFIPDHWPPKPRPDMT